RAETVLQRLVLAVRLADLEAVDAGVLVDGDVAGIEDLDDGRQPERLARLDDEAEAFLQRIGVGRAEPFPAAVRARAVLDDAAAEALCAGFLHQARRLHHLRFALDRARPGDEDEVVTAADDVPDLDRLVDRPLGRPLLRHALVGARDRDQLLDAGELLDLADRELRDVAVDADERDLLADHLPGLEAETVELLLDGRDLVRRRVPPHFDQHRSSSPSFRRLGRRGVIAIEAEAMRQEAVVALDEGTTGVRALVVDARGTARAEAYRELLPACPQAGWV